MRLPCGAEIKTSLVAKDRKSVSVNITRGGHFARIRDACSREPWRWGNILELVVYVNNLPVLAKYISKMAKKFAPRKRKRSR